MILHFIRHGESEANLLWEFSNSADKHPLTEKGRRQAYDLAQSLKHLPISACYTSPILRAVQTAQIISNELGVPYQVADALREFDVGIFEGRSDKASWERFFTLVDSWIAGKDRDKGIDGGESFLDIQHRFVPFINNLIEQDRDTEKQILIIGHGGTLRCMLPMILTNIDFSYVSWKRLPNTAIVSAQCTPEGLVCLQWGEDKFVRTCS